MLIDDIKISSISSQIIYFEERICLPWPFSAPLSWGYALNSFSMLFFSWLSAWTLKLQFGCCCKCFLKKATLKALYIGSSLIRIGDGISGPPLLQTFLLEPNLVFWFIDSLNVSTLTDNEALYPPKPPPTDTALPSCKLILKATECDIRSLSKSLPCHEVKML